MNDKVSVSVFVCVACRPLLKSDGCPVPPHRARTFKNHKQLCSTKSNQRNQRSLVAFSFRSFSFFWILSQTRRGHSPRDSDITLTLRLTVGYTRTMNER